MKLKTILLLFILFNQNINQNISVINSCGKDDFKISHKMPTSQDDCKDGSEKFCKFVSIKDNNNETFKFCAVVHGNYNDKDVLDEVKKLINVKEIEVLGSNHLIGRNSIIIKIFFYILLFLF